ncbi:MAG: F0F1 ATP synthase assembly protein I [Hyphomicrobiales bacterium]|nr:MAG: F0F1 ATP synthase assembly protein I [Hyphomicrobiales bacterium]
MYNLLIGENVSDKNPPERSRDSEGNLSNRLEALDTALSTHRKAEPSRHGKADEGPNNNVGLVFRMSGELVAGGIAGAGVGWLIDAGLGTKPWAFLIFLLLGIATGFINLIRVARNYQSRQFGEDQPDNHENT